MSKISVIIPIYNAEKYLHKCIQSVTNQTFTDLEIILVDDGSTDSSGKICDFYAEKDSRIKVIHKENGGLVSARKAGVNEAVSEYIGFIDADDWIDPDMYMRMYEKAVEYEVDLVTSGYILEGNYISRHLDNVDKGLYDSRKIQILREKTIYNLDILDVGVRTSLCCKLFKKDLLLEALERVSNDLTIAEDKVILLTYMLSAQSAYVMDKAYYHYVMHHGSMVNSADEKYLFHVDEVYKHFKQLYIHPNFTDSMRTQAELYITEMLYKGINSRIGFKHRNLLWIDPYWMDSLEEGTKVVLYGVGDLGKAYHRQILNNCSIAYVGCVDPKFEALTTPGFEVHSPDKLAEWEYDVIVITIKNEEKALDVKSELISRGIEEDKIKWFSQKEIFWRFAEANGMI